MKNFTLLLFLILPLLNNAQNTQSDYSTALTLYEKYEFKGAAHFFKKHLQNDSLDLTAWNRLGKCYYHLGQFDDAEKTFQKIIEIHPKNATALNQMAAICMKKEDFNGAVTYYHELAAIQKYNPYYIKKIASTYKAMEDYMCATGYYQRAYEMNPRDIESLAILADIYLQLRFPHVSDSLVQIGLEKDPYYKKLLTIAGKSKYVQGEYYEAYNFFKGIVSASSSVQNRRLLAICSYQTRRFDQAAKLLMELENEGNGNETSAYYLGLAYRAKEQQDSATYFLNEALNRGISNNIGTYLTELGITYQINKNYGKAIKTFNEAFQKTGKKVLLYHLARSYDEHYKDKNVAMKYYSQFLEAKDSSRLDYLTYSEKRLHEIKKELHFSADSSSLD